MTFPRDDASGVPGPRPDGQPGSEPLDPWAEEERLRAQEQGWVSESGGMGPIPARTWSRGNTRVMVGGCCLPLPIGCLTTVAAAGLIAAKLARRGLAG